MYTAETKQEIERVLAVFKPYIDQCQFYGICLVAENAAVCVFVP